MKLQSDLHVCNEPAAASLQRFNILGPLLEHETSEGTPRTCTRCSLRNMQRPNVILSCFAKLIKFVFQIKKKICKVICNITCHTMLLCKLANICGLNHNKYTSYEYWNLQFTKFKYYATQNLDSPLHVHRIDASWGEGRLLLVLGSCRLWIPNGSLPCSPINWHDLVMQNTTIVWLSINLMWNLSLKCLQGKFQVYWVYSFLPNSHIHRHA